VRSLNSGVNLRSPGVHRLFPGFSPRGCNRMTGGAGQTGIPLGVYGLEGCYKSFGRFNFQRDLEKSLGVYATPVCVYLTLSRSIKLRERSSLPPEYNRL
jgi:hypothetical protein